MLEVKIVGLGVDILVANLCYAKKQFQAVKKVVMVVCRVSQVNHTRQNTFSGWLVVLLMKRRCGYER
jgi:hypothetical protein